MGFNKKAAGFGAAAMAFAAATSAQGAEIGSSVYRTPAAVAAVYNWSGLYLGVQGGALGERNESVTPNGEVKGTLRNYAAHGTIGGYVGYNMQFSNIVVGIEGDMSAVVGGRGVSSSEQTIAPGLYASSASNPKWDASVTGRLGYAFNNLLIYGKGGISFLNADHTGNIENMYGTNLGSQTLSSTRTGWVAGAGIEYAWNKNLISRIEGTYADYGTRAETFTIPGTGSVQVNTRASNYAVKAGLAYKF